jgi:hypothetical protein
VILSRFLHLQLQQLSRTGPWAAASPYLQHHTADLHQAALMLFDQPDPHSVELNPTATKLQLNLPLSKGGLGVSDLDPGACTAALNSSTTRAASALSAAAIHLHFFNHIKRHNYCMLALPAYSIPDCAPRQVRD